jgi:hypothetical protein
MRVSGRQTGVAARTFRLHKNTHRLHLTLRVGERTIVATKRSGGSQSKPPPPCRPDVAELEEHIRFVPQAASAPRRLGINSIANTVHNGHENLLARVL